MTFTIGEKIYYPNHGPCLVGAVVTKVIGGRSTAFYRLAPLDNGGGALFIPLDKISAVGIRRLMKKSDIPKLLSQIRHQPETPVLPPAPVNWKQRATEHSALLASGSAFDLARIIGSLTALKETKALPSRDRQVLDKARKNLICEISEVTGESKTAVEQQLESALQMRKAGS
jgi:CarD family transcriptional regulator